MDAKKGKRLVHVEVRQEECRIKLMRVEVALLRRLLTQHPRWQHPVVLVLASSWAIILASREDHSVSR